MNEPVVSVRDLGKTYWLYSSNFRRVMGAFMNPASTGATPLKVLSGLTFDLYPGEAVAIIGKNGTGKSTALQILAGIIPATEGSYTIRGRVSALLELGSGFNPEFTGRENIAIAGALAGLSGEEISALEPSIVEFADIGNYIDQPVKYYSSGMFIRLAFAIAIAGNPNILIVDEALAVGDIFFRQKCYNRLREMRERGMAVLLVTHSSGDVLEFCDKAILLEKGEQAYNGDPQEAMLRYYFMEQGISAGEKEKLNAAGRSINWRSESDTQRDDLPWPHLHDFFTPIPPSSVTGIPGAMFESYCITNKNDIPCTTFMQGQKMRLYTKLRLDKPFGLVSADITIWDSTGVPVFCKGTHLMDSELIDTQQAPLTVHTLFEVKLGIACGEYTLSTGCSSIDFDIYKHRETSGYEEWESMKRICGVRDLSVITVILPLSQKPSRVTTFGLVDLETQAVSFTRII